MYQRVIILGIQNYNQHKMELRNIGYRSNELQLRNESFKIELNFSNSTKITFKWNDCCWTIVIWNPVSLNQRRIKNWN